MSEWPSAPCFHPAATVGHRYTIGQLGGGYVGTWVGAPAVYPSVRTPGVHPASLYSHVAHRTTHVDVCNVPVYGHERRDKVNVGPRLHEHLRTATLIYLAY